MKARLRQHPCEHIEAQAHLAPVALAVLPAEGLGGDLLTHAHSIRRQHRDVQVRDLLHISFTALPAGEQKRNDHTEQTMSTDTLDEQLVKYLTDVHSIERQALVQMKAAPGMAGDEEIASAFSDHLVETEGHERLVTERLEAYGAQPSKIKDLAGTLTGAGFGAFAKAQPDTTGKLVAHAFAYEHMEEAAYDLLGRVARRCGDSATVDVAALIERQEHEMGDRLAASFDLAVDAALRER